MYPLASPIFFIDVFLGGCIIFQLFILNKGGEKMSRLKKEANTFIAKFGDWCYDMSLKVL